MYVGVHENIWAMGALYLNACAGNLEWVASFYTNACGMFYINACEMGGLNDDNCMLKMYAQVGH